jgi:4-hydroxy-tetrahydrodipicolinate reductase
MTQMNIAIAGAGGRMGRILIEAVQNADDARLSARWTAPVRSRPTRPPSSASRPACRWSRTWQGPGRRAVPDRLHPPGSTLEHLKYCAEHGIKLVIGTTGFDDAGKAAIAEAAKKTAIVFSPNLSVGVNVTMKLLEQAAKALSTGYDIEIIEAHHRFKVDAPSGTALKMGEVIADALGRDLKEHGVFAREGVTGERDPSSIGFATIRGGDIVATTPCCLPASASASRSATSRAAA